MRAALSLVSLFALACAPESTPVASDRAMTARYVDDAAHVGLGGALVTNGIAFEPCEAATLSVDPATYTFEGNEGAVEIELPDADLCGVRIVVLQLVIEAEHDGVAKTVIGQDFDFWIPGEHVPTEGGLVLQLGHDTWLADFLPLAAEGTTTLNSETSEDLLVAFYDGLHQGSSLDAQETIVEQGQEE